MEKTERIRENFLKEFLGRLNCLNCGGRLRPVAPMEITSNDRSMAGECNDCGHIHTLSLIDEDV